MALSSESRVSRHSGRPVTFRPALDPQQERLLGSDANKLFDYLWGQRGGFNGSTRPDFVGGSDELGRQAGVSRAGVFRGLKELERNRLIVRSDEAAEADERRQSRDPDSKVPRIAVTLLPPPPVIPEDVFDYLE